MSRRAQRPLNQSAAQAADNEVYSRHKDDPRPNALYDDSGNRRPLSSDDPTQAAAQDEWLDSYAANGGATESKPTTVAPPPGSPVVSCPLRANLDVRLVHACDESPLAGGTVRITGAEMHEATTDGSGWARFENILAGVYHLAGIAPHHEAWSGSRTAAGGTTTAVVLPLKTAPKIKPVKPAYTVVLDKAGNPPGAFPMLEFQITDGVPGHLFDVQLSRAGALNGGPGLAGSWKEADDRDKRMNRTHFSSWSNGQHTLRLDGSGAATYRVPLEWWRDQARQKLTAFKEFKYSYRVVTFKDGPTAICGKSAPATVPIRNNLLKFKVVDLGYVSGGTDKSIRMEIKVREANTTEMYTFVQWKIGGRETYAGHPPVMTRPTVKDYNVTHISTYPVWQLDRVGTNPRYWDGTYRVDPDGLGMNATDQPSGDLIGGGTHAFTHITFDTRVHLNFEVPGAVKVTRQDGSAPIYGVVVGVIDKPLPIILAHGGWNTRVLQVRQRDGTVALSHPNSFGGP